MEVQRFTGVNNKQALDKVRATLGSEALILSNERTADGIQVIAQAGSSQANARNPSASNEINLGYLSKELKALRELIQASLHERSWRDVAGKSSLASTLEHRLATLGLSKESITAVLDPVGISSDLNIAWQKSLDSLRQQIKVTSINSDADTALKVVFGGSVGCRGLAICQLARAILLEKSPSNLFVLSVSADPSKRLRDFCQKNRIRYLSLNEDDSLKGALRKYSGDREVLVETSDLSPSLGLSDPALRKIVDFSDQAAAIMIIPATCNSDYLASVVAHLRSFTIVGGVISQSENAVSMGGVLNFLINHDVAASGVLTHADQPISRVTEDWLISRAKKLAREKLAYKSALHNVPKYALN